MAAALVISAPGGEIGPREFVRIELFAPASASGESAEATAQVAAPAAQADEATAAREAAALSEHDVEESPASLAQLVEAPIAVEAQGEGAPSLTRVVEEPLLEESAAPATALRLEAVSAEGAALAGMGASDARRIVYVLDASGSMVTTWPDAAQAVAQSVRALHPTQRFAILAHPQASGGDWPTGAAVAAPRIPRTASKPMLLDATPDNVEGALAWLSSRAPSGRSVSHLALPLAASLGPDAIFLISSGDWDAMGQERSTPDAVVEQIARALGPTPPTIKVIAVEREDSTGALRAIGRAFGGEEGYRLLTAAELARRAGRAEAEAPAGMGDGPP